MNIEYTKEPNPNGEGWIVKATFKMERSIILKDETVLEQCKGALKHLICLDLFSGSKWAAVRSVTAAKYGRPISREDAETIFNPESAIVA